MYKYLNMNLKDITTRSLLAIYWSITVSIFIGYILVKWGDEKEILTLIIGLIGGTILGGIFSVYFGGDNTKHKDANSIGEPITDGDSVTVNKE